jgi:tRNA (cytidine/uridine-2'-O-)-methyltransferase
MEHYFNIVLYRPEIPPNTGNIARLCVGARSSLHLIGRLGFKLDNKSLKRAGLDYWDKLRVYYYRNFDEFLERINKGNIWLITKFGKKKYTDVKLKVNDYFIFGRETKGLPEEIHNLFLDNRLYIPMSDDVRSINLSNSVAMVLYEAIRQNKIDF